MTETERTQVTYDFDYGEVHTHQVFAASDIELHARGIPGLYAWYVRIPPSAELPSILESYATLFGSKQLSVRAAGPLRERYRGIMARERTNAPAVPFSATSLALASTIFSPPIYIGISEDIGRRLRDHLRSLTANLASEQGTTKLDGPSPDTDTKQESQLFGIRIGDLLKRSGIPSVNYLFIKVAYQPGLKLANLQPLERFLNTTFIPLCGRR